VISADEKTSIQARSRCHPTLPCSKDRPVRVEHEYERKGALAYLAAWDVHRARLFGRCETKNGIEPFGRLVEQVMREEPYASADRVFWMVDNGSSHRGERSVRRLEGEWPNSSPCGGHAESHPLQLDRSRLGRVSQERAGKVDSAGRPGGERAVARAAQQAGGLLCPPEMDPGKSKPRPLDG
jgi:DDE superfamily endonuclease